jgi:hypothetical protein
MPFNYQPDDKSKRCDKERVYAADRKECTYYWIGKGWVHVSDRLRDAIVGRMWEIYNNAFEHSGTPIGGYSCGQYFKTHNNLILSVVDFGQGQLYWREKQSSVAKRICCRSGSGAAFIPPTA